MTKELDVHGYTVLIAKKAIQRQAMQMEGEHGSTFIVIHGFNNGNAISNEIRKPYSIHCKVIEKILPMPFNEGASIVWIK